MIFLTRKPGEALTVETPSGKIVVQVLGRDQFGVELPAACRVSASSRVPAPGQWLPERPVSRAS